MFVDNGRILSTLIQSKGPPLRTTTQTRPHPYVPNQVIQENDYFYSDSVFHTIFVPHISKDLLRSVDILNPAFLQINSNWTTLLPERSIIYSRIWNRKTGKHFSSSHAEEIDSEESKVPSISGSKKIGRSKSRSNIPRNSPARRITTGYPLRPPLHFVSLRCSVLALSRNHSASPHLFRSRESGPDWNIRMGRIAPCCGQICATRKLRIAEHVVRNVASPRGRQASPFSLFRQSRISEFLLKEGCILRELDSSIRPRKSQNTLARFRAPGAGRNSLVSDLAFQRKGNCRPLGARHFAQHHVAAPPFAAPAASLRCSVLALSRNHSASPHLFRSRGCGAVFGILEAPAPRRASDKSAFGGLRLRIHVMRNAHFFQGY